MPPNREELIPTRATLLERLKNWEDQASWQQFFDTYWKLIYGFARKAGLTPDEAQDAVQETMFATAKHMPGFKYNPAIGSFKSWLLQMTRWRITDQLRARGPLSLNRPESGDAAAATRTDVADKVPDPDAAVLEAQWEAEWQTNLLEAAVANVKRRADPLKYQLFDCSAKQGWPAEKVAHTFGVPVEHVYMAKHRMTELVKAEVKRLEKEMT